MLLTIDAGNTNISFGIYDGDEVVTTFRLSTKVIRTTDDFGQKICGGLELRGYSKDDIHDVILCSVVPNINDGIITSIEKYLGITPMVVSIDLKTAIKVETDFPRKTGADRIVDLEAAYHLYGGKVIVCDFGTASKFDYVDENGVFKYGVIAPGIQISGRALTSQAAQLPDITIEMPDSILASNTISSMQAGLVYGYVGLVEKIVHEMKKQLNVDCKVIATGGLGRLIVPYTDCIDLYDPDLTLKGIKIIYDNNKSC